MHKCKVQSACIECTLYGDKYTNTDCTKSELRKDLHRHPAINHFRMTNIEKALRFIRAKQIMTMQTRGNDQPAPVYISFGEFDATIQGWRNVLRQLIDTGMVKLTTIKSRKGHDLFLYDAGPGPYDLSLLVKGLQKLTQIEEKMRSYLLLTGLQPGAASTMYFDVFLRHKDSLPELFFKVDKFAGRVHTPVSNFHRTHRPFITIDGSPIASLDVTTMQPLILGKVLENVLPGNEFSRWINEGVDIYTKLQTASGLQTRDEGKKRFFEIAFSPPSDALSNAFGKSEWVEWVNWYKGQHEPRNSHNSEKMHSNLAWLLQNTEVGIMQKIWTALVAKNIQFLSVHDEIIVKTIDEAAAGAIMHQVLNNEFKYYKLNSKSVQKTVPQKPSTEFLDAKKRETELSTPNVNLAAWDEPVQGLHIFIPSAQTEPPHDSQILQKYIDEAQRSFRKSMVKHFTEYYPMFIQSNYAFIRRDGIDPEKLRAALSLCKQQKFSNHATT